MYHRSMDMAQVGENVGMLLRVLIWIVSDVAMLLRVQDQLKLRSVLKLRFIY